MGSQDEHNSLRPVLHAADRMILSQDYVSIHIRLLLSSSYGFCSCYTKSPGCNRGCKAHMIRHLLSVQVHPVQSLLPDSTSSILVLSISLEYPYLKALYLLLPSPGTFFPSSHMSCSPAPPMFCPDPCSSNTLLGRPSLPPFLK